MQYYPLFVSLKDKHCLVIGAGGVGKRKSRSLIDSGAASVTIVDTRPADPDFEDVTALENVTFACREFQESDLDSKFLVIACTSSPKLNELISTLCARRDILCNIVDQPEIGNFIVPATVKRGDLTLAISTAGQSPAMTKRIRRELQEEFGEEYGAILTLMGRIRPLMLSLGLETKENTAVFRALVNSKLLDVLKLHDLDAAREILKESLPQPLYANIPELLDGLI